MILQILSHTPAWVWLLLAFLLYRAFAATRPRDVSPRRALIVPIVFFVWGVASLLGATDGMALKLTVFLAALLAGLALGGVLASLSPTPRLRSSGLIAMPGSLAPLVLIVLAFATKYAGNVALALAADGAARTELSIAMAAIAGIFAGAFWGRTLGQFRRALQTDGKPATLASLANLVIGQAAGGAPEALT